MRVISAGSAADEATLAAKGLNYRHFRARDRGLTEKPANLSVI